jgi:putative DNA methylase
MRRGHVPLLYIWPATRPPAACRAIICASLWPDPADPLCPQRFRDDASRLINEFARKATSNKELAAHCSQESWTKWQNLSNSGGLDSTKKAHWNVLRFALLDFIADFSNVDHANISEYLETSRGLSRTAHESLGDPLGNKPLVVDPFAGGGAIPLEALRIGADAFASDLNPVAWLLNKVVLEYIPKYGQLLATELSKWSAWATEKAKTELGKFYPSGANETTPIAYLWARTITCEGPGCGAELPLMRSLWLARKGIDSVALRVVPNIADKRVDFEIIDHAKANEVGTGTIRRGSATCTLCGYTTQVSSVRRQLKQRRGGTADARLYCVVSTRPGEQGRVYRLPTEQDLDAVRAAGRELTRRIETHNGHVSLVPDEPLPPQGTLGFRVQLYGMETWGDLFTPRQALAISTYARLASEYAQMDHLRESRTTLAVASVLALVVNRLADLNASLCAWQLNTPNTAHVFVRWVLPMVLDFGEVNPLAAAGGSPESAIRRVKAAIEDLSAGIASSGVVGLSPATKLPLPDRSASAFITDPPYYDAVPYADLSDFFYVWLKRTLGDFHGQVFSNELTPKDDECIVDELKKKDRKYFESTIGQAMAEGRRILSPGGIGLVIFAHKSTSGWEAQLQAMVDAGWTITASWPIDTEMASRMRAMDSAVLASSVHIVCRSSDDMAGMKEQVGDWRDVLAELPKRIHEWMPRLATEGVVGADAIFACLGPALEVFSRYGRVEKANGEQVHLKEYLEYVWAAVSKEALNMIFEGADATGFEEDARLTAMWLWTLSTDSNGSSAAGDVSEDEEEEDSSDKKAKLTGFVLEYDAARKIAQGLGAHLDRLPSLVEISGDKALLLSVSQRAGHLFGKDEGATPTKRKGNPKQLSLLDVLGETDEEAGGWGEKNASTLGNTVLDRIHQSMILFGASRSEALKRFLVSDGAGQDQRFWRLAQALSALYPKGTDERRWVEGVLARKKGLGF